MEVFKTTRQYSKMAGIYNYRTDHNKELVLVRFSDNLDSLTNATPVYRNDFFEITLSYPQAMRFNVSGIDHNTLEAPTLSFISPLEIQQCTGQGYPNEVHMLLIDPRLLGITNYKSPYYRRYKHFNPTLSNTLPLTPTQFDNIADHFNKLEAGLNARSDSRDLFHEFYHGVSKVLESTFSLPSNVSRKVAIFEDFTAELKRSSLAHNSIREISDRLAISYTHLSDTIKEVTQFSPTHHSKAFINRLSRSYLLHTDHKIKDIAHELGFSSQAHFSNFFRDTNGVTPTQFRQKPK